MTENRKTAQDIRKEIGREEAERAKLLASLEIPEYTGRVLRADWVKKITGRAITGRDGMTALAPQGVVDLLKEGDVYIFETKGFNTISGWIVNGKWYDRKSDQDIQRQHEEWQRDSVEKHNAHVEEHREEWTQREAALPDWLKSYMTEAREENDEFESALMGWGYALVACELAAMYANMGEGILDKNVYSVEDTDEISEFARTNGTSGNQHGFALTLAKRHILENKS